MYQNIGRSVSCPAGNCYGQVGLAEWRDDDGNGPIVLAGSCDTCGQESVECSECEDVTWLFDGSETQCDGCEAVYQQVLDRKGLTDTFRRVR